MQPTSVHAPSDRAVCQAPLGTIAWTTDPAPGSTSPPSLRHRDRRVALGPGPQLEVVTGRPLPDLVGVEAMPVRALAGRQQEQDRAARRSRTVDRRRLPRLGIPAALRMRPHPETIREPARVAHELSVSAAATAKPAAVVRPTSLFFSP